MGCRSPAPTLISGQRSGRSRTQRRALSWSTLSTSFPEWGSRMSSVSQPTTTSSRTSVRYASEIELPFTLLRCGLTFVAQFCCSGLSVDDAFTSFRCAFLGNTSTVCPFRVCKVETSAASPLVVHYQVSRLTTITSIEAVRAPDSPVPLFPSPKQATQLAALDAIATGCLTRPSSTLTHSSSSTPSLLHKCTRSSCSTL